MPFILKIKCLLNINYIECPQPIILSSLSSTAAKISRIRRSSSPPIPSLLHPSARNFPNCPFGRNPQAPSRNSNKKKIGRRSGRKPPTKILIFPWRSNREDALSWSHEKRCPSRLWDRTTTPKISTTNTLTPTRLPFFRRSLPAEMRCCPKAQNENPPQKKIKKSSNILTNKKWMKKTKKNCQDRKWRYSLDRTILLLLLKRIMGRKVRVGIVERQRMGRRRWLRRNGPSRERRVINRKGKSIYWIGYLRWWNLMRWGTKTCQFLLLSRTRPANLSPEKK